MITLISQMSDIKVHTVAVTGTLLTGGTPSNVVIHMSCKCTTFPLILPISVPCMIVPKIGVIEIEISLSLNGPIGWNAWDIVKI